MTAYGMLVSMKKLRWGLLACGGIAKAFARGIQHSELGELAAAGSRSLETAEQFAKEFQIPRAHGSYESLLADPEVDAVYISTPHPMHAEWIIKASEAGKHVLCEKPFTLNYAEAMVVTAAAQAHDILLMEAFMVRCHPAIAKLVEALKNKSIGDIRLIKATFSFNAGYNPESRLFKNSLGGGGILDVGCYTTTLSRLIAGTANGVPFADPLTVKGSAGFLESGADGWAAATLEFPGNIIAQVSTGVQLNQDNGIQIYGSEGSIHFPNCWIPAKEGGKTSFFIRKDGKSEEEVCVETTGWLYAYEADAFARAWEAGLRSVPEMPIADSLGNMKTLDAWRKSAGLVYEMEKPSPDFPTISRRPLKKSPSSRMRYGRLQGLDLDVSRLILGCDNQADISYATAIFDDFYERGGNAFDTAWIYAGGLQERLLGHWIRSRNLRSDVFVIGKGAHTPFCEPKHVEWQLDETLNRLQSGYVDMYLLHRDNPEVPVGEFVDCFNGLIEKKKLKLYGGSNWSLQRVEEANEYAKAKGLQGFSAVSNNFSLARMVDPVWTGCISASDKDSKAWLEKTRTPLFAWSSQARGFFTERAGIDKREDEELVRCWYSEDNFQRRERVLELAEKKKASPISIALAYVLHQSFPTFALIGPRQISETVSSFAGLDLELSDEELAWLNLES